MSSNPAASLVAVTPVSEDLQLQALPFSCKPLPLPMYLYVVSTSLTLILVTHKTTFSSQQFGVQGMSDSSEVPRWLSALLTEKFFNACIIHQDEKKNEKNVFCFDCCAGICPYCFVHHRSHRLLQIRRYMYHDVIRIKEAEKLMDCAQVQFYRTNSAKVVFLNRRPPTRPSKTCSSFCINCDKNLQDSYIFCCLYCKLQHLLRNGSKLSKFLRNCNFPVFCEPGLDDGQLTPDSVLELSGSVRTESGLGGLLISHITRKKRSNHLAGGVRSMFRPACAPVYVMNRRKGTPHRSPLY